MNNDLIQPIIPFYGTNDPELFAIERAAMDHDGKLIAALNELLPAGRVLDIGAGNGFTATRLHEDGRTIVPLEPAAGMIDQTAALPWVQGVAQTLPFADQSLAAAYATWAYFFPTAGYGAAGLAEVERVVQPGGPIIVADNGGNDEFCALFETDIAGDADWWLKEGFTARTVSTSFRFTSLVDAERLLSLYWRGNGRRPGSQIKLEYEYNVIMYVKMAPSKRETR